MAQRAAGADFRAVREGFLSLAALLVPACTPNAAVTTATGTGSGGAAATTTASGELTTTSTISDTTTSSGELTTTSSGLGGSPGTTTADTTGSANGGAGVTSATTSTEASSSVSSGSGVPCHVGADDTCAVGKTCCFKTSGVGDECDNNPQKCPNQFVPLQCQKDSDCGGGEKCCAFLEGFSGNKVERLICDFDCIDSPMERFTCDPTKPLPSCPGSTTCKAALSSYYMNTVPPPYDVYGICN